MMNNVILTLLCCCTLLSACDNFDTDNSDGKSSLLDKVTSPVSAVAEKATDGIDNVLKSVKDKADSAADATNTITNDAIGKAEAVTSDAADSAKKSQEVVVDSVDAATDTAKETSSDIVKKSSEVVAAAGPGYAEEGESIYTSNCIACHGAGVAGAPKLGDTLAWAPRIAQGDKVMIQHAIEGYKGDTGYMPAKGGYANLSDADIVMTVRYMISQSQ